MELFSEVYSCYYSVVNKILNQSLKKTLSKRDINEIIEENAFQESALYILPKLISGEWSLLNNIESGYTSKLSSSAKLPVTALEKAWLKSLLQDKRIGLFLNKEQILVLSEYLKEVTPLFNKDDFYYFDTFIDGDNYESEEYVKNFGMILEALKNRKLLTISMESGKGRRVTGNYIPCKIEYSSKDDKFRLYVARIKYNKVVAYAIMNIARISKIEPCEEGFSGEINLEIYISNNKCKEPVVIEISKERNAVERCMLHFASYEKRTEYDEIADKYICYIYYDRKDETELLIRILSFGPVIRVLGPTGFLGLVKERVRSEAELLGNLF
jgi:hypothetical protein